MKHKTAFLLLVCLSARAAQAQNELPCATDLLHQRALQQPAHFHKHHHLEQEAYQFFSQPPAAARGSQVLTVPVVVHIVHDNGPENISDAAVQQAVQWLNQAFANAGYFDQGSGADAGIQFCLAQRTPDGQPTDGITRDQNALTVFTAETQELTMKNINRWKPKDYINIWVVRDICSTTYGCGIVAYAYYPSFHGNNLDGIVIEANYLNSASNVSVLAHEMGHYFGLYHTFEGGCTNNDCLLNGDRVCDTPPDQSTAAVPCDQAVNTCSTDAQSGFATDQPDMLQNHMDYGHIDCKHDFTPGQADRMNYFLNGTRKSLLDSKGCLPPCPLPTLAAFTPGDTTINAGQTLFFDNTSQNAVNFSWTLNGVPFGGQQNAAYLFDSAGVFTVKLVAQPLNGQLCEASSAQVTVQVVCEVTADFSVSTINPVENDPVFITNSSLGATQFEWFVNGVSQGPVLDSVSFSPEGVYALELLASNPYCQDASQVLLTVRDSCKNPGFQMAISTGNTSISYWNSGRIAHLNDGTVVCGSGFSYSTQKRQVFFSKMAGNGEIIWSKTFGDSTLYADVLALRSFPDGGFAAVTLIGAGFFSFDQSGVMKFSPDGELLWYRYFLSDSSEYLLRDIVCNPDGSIVACGRTNTTDEGHILVVKLDPNGSLIWGKRYRAAPGSRRAGVSIARTSDNGYVIAGHTAGSINWDGIVMKLDSNGSILWNKKLASIQHGYPNKIKVLANGSIILAGYMVGANTNDLSKGWIARMSPNGQLLWSYSVAVPGPTEVVLYDLEEGPGEYFTAVGTATEGVLPGGKDRGAIFRFDTAGQCLWVQIYNNAEDSYFQDIAPAPGGCFYIKGADFFNPANSSRSFRLLKTDPAGFTGDCTPETFIPQMASFSVGSSNETYTLLPVIPLDSVTLEKNDIASQVDTLCAPECYVSPELCNNNLDDDGDGLFDCLDPDCNCPEDVCAPKQANIWYFGDHAGLDFNTEPPTVLTDGQTEHIQGSAVMCDAHGNLLFYSDGKKIFNRFHEPMPNGDSLSSGAIPSYEVIALPHPGDAGLYYLFFVTNGGLNYDLIDMKMDGGKGDVVSNATMLSLVEFRLAAVRACDFKGYWIVVKTQLQGIDFYAFRIDENGLNPAAVYSTSEINSIFTFGQMKFSPDGKRLAKVTGLFGAIELYDFDVSGGAVSGGVVLNVPPAARPYGIEFSPNGRFLYVSMHEPVGLTTKIIQFDLEAGAPAQIEASLQEVATKSFIPSSAYTYGALQIAPDGKIYVTNNNILGVPGSSLHIIHQPDLPAPACQFQENGLALMGTPGASGGLVNIASNLFARPAISFSQTARDTICVLDSHYTYTAEKSGCFATDSITWKMEGLTGTLDHDDENGWVTFDAPGSGRIIVTAYTECGIASDTLPIVVAHPFDKTLDLGPDQEVCDNGLFTFNAGGGFARYRWQNGSPDSVLTTLLPGQYWVEVWDACGNRQTDTVTVSIASATVLDLGDDREGCDDLTATFQRPDFFSRWQWTPGDFIPCDTCASVTVAPATTTSWVVVAQTDNGCISVDTLTFVIRDTLFFQLDTSVCSGQTIAVFGVSLPADTTAHFFFPATGPGCDTLLTVNVLGLDAPVWELEATVCPGAFFDFNGTLLPTDTTAVFLFSAAGNACDSVVTVTVSGWPSLTVALPPDTTLRVGATLVLNAETTGTGPFSFAWSPAGSLSCADCPNPVAAPLETTLYTLAATDANGCSAQDSVLVTVDPACVVVIPNAFTPNGDGVNDRFYPRTDPCVRTVRAWRVASRWGEPVFERFSLAPDDPALGWDGNRPDGEPFPSDLLVWYAELEYYDGRKEVRKGDVALLR